MKALTEAINAAQREVAERTRAVKVAIKLARRELDVLERTTAKRRYSYQAFDVDNAAQNVTFHFMLLVAADRKLQALSELAREKGA